MSTRIDNYWSMFNVHFIYGLSVLAFEAGFERQNFLKAIRSLPNFNNIAQREVRDMPSLHQIRVIGWSVLMMILMLSTTVLTFLRLNIMQIVMIIFIIIMLTPIILLYTVAWCLPKARRASRC